LDRLRAFSHAGQQEYMTAHNSGKLAEQRLNYLSKPMKLNLSNVRLIMQKTSTWICTSRIFNLLFSPAKNTIPAAANAFSRKSKNENKKKTHTWQW